VLRYWESEFAALRPLKTRGAHRMYRRADVELACVIRRLLHEEGYTIPGAKKRVRELQAQRHSMPAQPELSAQVELANSELGARGELQQPPRESLVQIRREAQLRANPEASRELSLRAELIQLRAELAALLDSLDQPAAGETQPERPATATVTAVVPKTVLIQQRLR
jgi:DNA-binding transcriptional MerR regulator